MSVGTISKAEAARRQLDTAIDLYFNHGDSLSAYALAYAGFKVLFDLYPKKQGDGFDEQLDGILGETGWKALSEKANFLKHADRDPDALMSHHHRESVDTILVFAVILYGRIVGELTTKMMAFDSWTDALAAEELNIPEVDTNEKRAAEHRRYWQAVKLAPEEEKMKHAKQYYDLFLKNSDHFQMALEEAKSLGKSFEKVLDEILDVEKPNSAA